MFRFKGPSRAQISLLTLHSRNANGLEIENADQAQARVFGLGWEILFASRNNVLVDRVNNTKVDFWHSSHCNQGGPGVLVNGGSLGLSAPSRVALYGGASCGEAKGNPSAPVYHVADNGKLIVADTWYEGWSPRFLNLTNTSGQVTISSGHATPYAEVPDEYGVTVDGFKGTLTYLGVTMAYGKKIRFSGSSVGTTALIMANSQQWTPHYFENTSTGGAISFLTNHWYQNHVGTHPVPDQGSTDSSTILAALAPLRAEKLSPLTALPAGVTDFRIEDIRIDRPIVGIRVVGTDRGRRRDCSAYDEQNVRHQHYAGASAEPGLHRTGRKRQNRPLLSPHEQ
jgi:hypothetical protein